MSENDSFGLGLFAGVILSAIFAFVWFAVAPYVLDCHKAGDQVIYTNPYSHDYTYWDDLYSSQGYSPYRSYHPEVYFTSGRFYAINSVGDAAVFKFPTSACTYAGLDYGPVCNHKALINYFKDK